MRCVSRSPPRGAEEEQGLDLLFVSGAILHFGGRLWVILSPMANILRSFTSLLSSQHPCFDFIDLAEVELRGLHNPFLPPASASSLYVTRFIICVSALPLCVCVYVYIYTM